MTMIAAIRATQSGDDVLLRLRSVCASHGLGSLGDRLIDLAELVQPDMRAIESDLRALERGERLAEKGAFHLLDLGGKRLRPMCVALASRVGTGFADAAQHLAVGIELVHNATLLHDDVVDMGDVRRGEPTARTIYGNAASIFAGDYLLVTALKRVRRAGLDDVTDRLLDVIEEMIRAESIQLENRGQIKLGRDTYMQIVEGKTASLFRWAMFAGARAGGLPPASCDALERYGNHLGVAFQAIDDVLDYAGDEGATGKKLFADLREGKMTYPLIVALERDPSLFGVVRDIAGLAPEDTGVFALASRLKEGLASTRAIADCQSFARERARAAIECLADVPDGRARQALVTVAEATVHRDS